MRTINRGEFTTFVFCLSSQSQHHENTDIDQVTKSVVNHIQTSLQVARQNPGMTLPFDPSVEVIRYQHTQMTSEPIKQQHSQSEMTKRLDKLEGQWTTLYWWEGSHGKFYLDIDNPDVHSSPPKERSITAEERDNTSHDALPRD